jgi:hypothetical protein
VAATPTSQSSTDSQIQVSPNDATVLWVYGDVADISPKPKMTTSTEA